MSAITWPNVLEIAPDAAATAALSAVPVPLQTHVLAHVNGSGLDPDIFDGEAGTDTGRARRYLAAHIATVLTLNINGASGASGPLASETEGDISRSYVNILALAGMTSELDRTVYGSLFKLMARVAVGGGIQV